MTSLIHCSTSKCLFYCKLEATEQRKVTIAYFIAKKTTISNTKKSIAFFPIPGQRTRIPVKYLLDDTYFMKPEDIKKCPCVAPTEKNSYQNVELE